jgi:hypothetical protein
MSHVHLRSSTRGDIKRRADIAASYVGPDASLLRSAALGSVLERNLPFAQAMGLIEELCLPNPVSSTVYHKETRLPACKK